MKYINNFYTPFVVYFIGVWLNYGYFFNNNGRDPVGDAFFWPIYWLVTGIEKAGQLSVWLFS